MRLPSGALNCHKRWKVSTFMKFEIILPLLCFLLDSLTNKHCKGWSSMLNLEIDFRTCQKVKDLLSARQRSNNYLELSKEKVLLNVMLSYLPRFTWKLLMIWFCKILRLIFQKPPSSPRNICTGHWRKPPNLTAFLELSYTLRTTILYNMRKKLIVLIVLLIYF